MSLPLNTFCSNCVYQLCHPNRPSCGLCYPLPVLRGFSGRTTHALDRLEGIASCRTNEPRAALHCPLRAARKHFTVAFQKLWRPVGPLDPRKRKIGQVKGTMGAENQRPRASPDRTDGMRCVCTSGPSVAARPRFVSKRPSRPPPAAPFRQSDAAISPDAAALCRRGWRRRP